MIKKLLFLLIVFQLQHIESNAQFGKAIYLDGTNDFVQIPDNNYLDLYNNFTVEATINQLRIPGIVNIINKGWCGGGGYSYNLAVVDGIIWWQWNYSGSCTGNSRYESTDSVIGLGTCYHISIIHSSTYIKIYLNGTEIPGHLVAGSYSTLYNSSSEVRIGTYKNLNGTFSNNFWGLIDEVRIWNYKLSTAEINSYMYAPLTGNETGLIAYYDMNETGTGQGVVINNKAAISGNALNGITLGTTTSPQFVNSCMIASNDYESLEEFSVYPNPSFGSEIIIEANNAVQGSQKYNISICDMFGRSILNVNSSLPYILSKDDFDKGIYILKVSSTDFTYTGRIIFE